MYIFEEVGLNVWEVQRIWSLQLKREIGAKYSNFTFKQDNSNNVTTETIER